MLLICRSLHAVIIGYQQVTLPLLIYDTNDITKDNLSTWKFKNKSSFLFFWFLFSHKHLPYCTFFFFFLRVPLFILLHISFYSCQSLFFFTCVSFFLYGVCLFSLCAYFRFFQCPFFLYFFTPFLGFFFIFSFLATILCISQLHFQSFFCFITWLMLLLLPFVTRFSVDIYLFCRRGILSSIYFHDFLLYICIYLNINISQ